MTAESEHRCPECAGPVYWDLTCHTWPQGDRFMSCLPCDSAVYYGCDSDNCRWGYTHGLNTDNPRSDENEARRPPWIAEAKLEYSRMGIPRTVQGVVSLWEMEDEPYDC